MCPMLCSSNTWFWAYIIIIIVYSLTSLLILNLCTLCKANMGDYISLYKDFNGTFTPLIIYKITVILHSYSVAFYLINNYVYILSLFFYYSTHNLF